jgi:hypothetical protein
MPHSTNNNPSGSSGSGTNPFDNNPSSNTTTTPSSNTPSNPSNPSSNTNTNTPIPGTLESLFRNTRTQNQSPLTDAATAWCEEQFRQKEPQIAEGGMYFCQYFNPTNNNGDAANVAQFIGPDVIATRYPSGEVFSYDPYTDFGPEDFARYQELYGFLLEKFRSSGPNPTPSDSPGPWHLARYEGSGSGGSGGL